MNDRELKTHLARLTPEVAAADESYLRHRWTAGLVSAAGAALLLVGLMMIRQTPAEGGADSSTLAQVEALFPGQLNAVIERDGEVRLDLAGQASAVASEQPVLVQFERGGKRLRVLSYSGRSITLELQGERVTFEALVTSAGDVVLSGANFVWSSAQPGPLAGYNVNARQLDHAL
jgi:hypothetical protein